MWEYSLEAEHLHIFIFISYFILLASPNKQTKQLRIQKNIGRDTATALANYSGPGPHVDVLKATVKRITSTNEAMLASI